MFRFTIRDVLWLMVVVGLVAGWWIDHRSDIAMRLRLDLVEFKLKATISALEENGFDVYDVGNGIAVQPRNPN